MCVLRLSAQQLDHLVFMAVYNTGEIADSMVGGKKLEREMLLSKCNCGFKLSLSTSVKELM